MRACVSADRCIGDIGYLGASVVLHWGAERFGLFSVGGSGDGGHRAHGRERVLNVGVKSLRWVRPAGRYEWFVRLYECMERVSEDTVSLYAEVGKRREGENVRPAASDQ